MQPADFVRARLDELDAVARAVPLGFDLFDGTGVIVMPVHGGGSRSVTLPSNVAVFAGRFDPAYVLADVAAKRQIVAMCEFLLETREVQEAAGELSDYSLGRAHAGGGVLRRLALPFAEHPDYREEWRV